MDIPSVYPLTCQQTFVFVVRCVILKKIDRKVLVSCSVYVCGMWMRVCAHLYVLGGMGWWCVVPYVCMCVG